MSEQISIRVADSSVTHFPMLTKCIISNVILPHLCVELDESLPYKGGMVQLQAEPLTWRLLRQGPRELFASMLAIRAVIWDRDGNGQMENMIKKLDAAKILNNSGTYYILSSILTQEDISTGWFAPTGVRNLGVPFLLCIMSLLNYPCCAGF